LDWIETTALVTAFTTQVLFQSLITFVLKLWHILLILFVILVINVMIISKIGGAFLQELMTHNGKKALEKERKALLARRKTDMRGIGAAEKAMKNGLQGGMKRSNTLLQMGQTFNPAAWWGKTMLEVGKRVQRRANIKSRLCLLVSADGHLMSRLIARTPSKFWTRYKYIYKNAPIPPDDPLEVTDGDADYFWLIQKNALDMILNDYDWDTVDCDIYEFMLRLLVALVMHERRQRAEDKPIESQVHLELKNLLLIPTTDIASIHKRMKVAENEGRILSFAQAAERGGVEKEKLIHGDELFRSTQYAAVMDKEVLFNLYKTWKKNKLMRVLPSVLREQYEKEAEEPEDAVKRMMTTDPGWMQWTAQMNSQVHDTMGALQQPKKLKMLEGMEKKKPVNNNKDNKKKVTNVANTSRNTPQESKPADFDNMLTNLLSSAAVDQAAEDLYRRAQAQTDAVEELGRARRSNNAPSNHPPYDNRPTNGNGVHPDPRPHHDAPLEPSVLSVDVEQQRREDYYQLHGKGLGLNQVDSPVHGNVPDDADVVLAPPK
jgi:hypothetical protein